MSAAQSAGQELGNIVRLKDQRLGQSPHSRCKTTLNPKVDGAREHWVTQSRTSKTPHPASSSINEGFNSKVRLIVGGPCGLGSVYKTCLVVGNKAIKLRSDSPFLSIPCKSQQLLVLLSLSSYHWCSASDNAARLIKREVQEAQYGI